MEPRWASEELLLPLYEVDQDSKCCPKGYLILAKKEVYPYHQDCGYEEPEGY
jgi:hypothetical protein